jgi:hypothetical protein
MNEVVGFILLALGGLLVVVISIEVRDAIAAAVERRRLRRTGEPLPPWLDDSTPTEPGYHFGGSGFHLEGSGSLLRRRHRRRLDLEPRGRWGFAAKWIQDP